MPKFDEDWINLAAFAIASGADADQRLGKAKEILRMVITRYEAEKPVLPKADWSTAPAEAGWWSVDASGDAFWSLPELEPHLNTQPPHWGMWEIGDSEEEEATAISAGKIQLALGVDWRLLKEKRPEVAA